ncbi:hypothetical protein IJ579_07715 [bacterium]|nr:hypothetical protein [bacterium]
MGMAATQARFLSLTARKSNVEFQGQQINQQRTTLSNESASYYSTLCNLVVPTPPSIDNYTKISYTFNDGAMTNTITSMIANPKRNQDGIPYLVSYVQQWEDDYAPVEAASSFVQSTSVGYYIGNTQLRPLGSAATTPIVASKINLNGQDYNVQMDNGGYFVNKTSVVTGSEPCTDEDIENFEYYLFNDNYTKAEQIFRDGDVFTKEDGTLVTDFSNLVICLYNENETNPDYATQLVTMDEQGNFTKEVFSEVAQKHYLTDDELTSITYQTDLEEAELNREEAYKYLLNEKYNGNDQSGQWYVRYVKDSQTGTEIPYFYKASDLKNEKIYTTEGYGSVSCYTIGSTTRTKEVINAAGTIERDSSGRYVSLTLFGTDDEGNVTTDQRYAITYSLTTNTTTDEAAYNDALNEYNYQQAQYDKKVQDINSKLEIVQQQDKSLELNLKQLDTEEQAISTEMEAVEKVISNNVKDTFGTFKATG